jgi:hypothetical protein
MNPDGPCSLDMAFTGRNSGFSGSFLTRWTRYPSFGETNRVELAKDAGEETQSKGQQ